MKIIFSLATAFYRLLPKITILRPVKGEMAEKLKNCFSPGVIEIAKNKSGEKEAKVANSRYDSCSRNVERHEDLKNSVLLEREPNHFICKLFRIFIDLIKLLIININ